MIKNSLFLFALLTGLVSIGDDHIVYMMHTDAHEIMGQKQPANDVEVNLWFSDKNAATDTKGQKSIISTEKKLCYMIMKGQKSYLEMPIPVEFKKFLPDQVAKMMDVLKTTVTVKKLEEEKQILGVKCQTYSIVFDMTMSTMQMKLFVSEEVPFDYSAYREKYEDTFNRVTRQMLDENSHAELAKIVGFQMGSEMTMDMMGVPIRTRMEVTKITKENAPEGMYLPPADFKKLDKLPMPQAPSGTPAPPAPK